MKRAFTLTESLIVVVIIAIVAAIIFPTFLAAKRSAHIWDCASNQKQLGQALHLYAAEWDGFAPPYSTTKKVGTHGSWIDAQPRKWRGALADMTRTAEVFWCHLDPHRADRNFVAFGESADSHRAEITSYMINPLFTPGLFGSSEGMFRLNIDALPPNWPKPPAETVYVSDALWPDPNVTHNVLISGHGRTCNRLYLDGHVRNLSIEQ